MRDVGCSRRAAAVRDRPHRPLRSRHPYYSQIVHTTSRRMRTNSFRTKRLALPPFCTEFVHALNLCVFLPWG